MDKISCYEKTGKGIRGVVITYGRDKLRCSCEEEQVSKYSLKIGRTHNARGDLR